jgi:hypothetical protein
MRAPALGLATSLVSLACHRAATATPLDLSQMEGPGLVFDDVHVFDGVEDLGVVDVLVEGQQITHVGPVALDTRLSDSNVVVITGGGKLTLLPGLIDAHAHVSALPALARALSYGVTTVLDPFMHEETMGRHEWSISRPPAGWLGVEAALRLRHASMIFTASLGSLPTAADRRVRFR